MDNEKLNTEELNTNLFGGHSKVEILNWISTLKYFKLKIGLHEGYGFWNDFPNPESFFIQFKFNSEEQIRNYLIELGIVNMEWEYSHTNVIDLGTRKILDVNCFIYIPVSFPSDGKYILEIYINGKSGFDELYLNENDFLNALKLETYFASKNIINYLYYKDSKYNITLEKYGKSIFVQYTKEM